MSFAALYRDTLFLYMETCLMLNYPEKVPKLIAILEGLLFGRAATPKSGNSSPQESRDKCETNVEWKPIVNQYRVRYVQVSEWNLVSFLSSPLSLTIHL